MQGEPISLSDTTTLQCAAPPRSKNETLSQSEGWKAHALLARLVHVTCASRPDREGAQFLRIIRTTRGIADQKTPRR